MHAFYMWAQRKASPGMNRLHAGPPQSMLLCKDALMLAAGPVRQILHDIYLVQRLLEDWVRQGKPLCTVNVVAHTQMRGCDVGAHSHLCLPVCKVMAQRESWLTCCVGGLTCLGAASMCVWMLPTMSVYCRHML